MAGPTPAEKDIPLEHLKELKQKVSHILSNSAGSIKSWSSFPFERVTFGNYTADRLRKQWKRLKIQAHRQCTMEQDVDLIEAVLERRVSARNQRQVHRLPSDFPKKPPTPYTLFIMKLSKKGILNKYDNKHRFAEAGKMWKELDPAKKEKFFRKYRLAVQKHGMEVEEFKAAHPELTDMVKTKRKSDRKSTETEEEHPSSSKPADPYECGLRNFMSVKQEKYARKYNLEGEDLKRKLKKKFDRLSVDKQQRWSNLDSAENGINCSAKLEDTR